MSFRKIVVVSVVAAAFAGPSYAQSTLGELLDKGAKKITKEEWIAMLPVTSSGRWKDGQGESQLTFKPDGTFSGNALHYPSGSSSGAYGKWTVDEAGKVCIDERFSNWPTTHQDCVIRFKLGDEFFIVSSESDRSGKTLKNTMKKQ